MKQIYVVIRERGPAFEHSRPLEGQQAWPEHAAFMDALVAEGFVLLGGPLEPEPNASTSEALLVIRSDSPEEIGNRLAADPWTTLNMLRTTRISVWIIRLGNLP